MPPVNGGPEMGTQIWLQKPEPKPWDVLGGGGGKKGGKQGERKGSYEIPRGRKGNP